MINDVTLAGAVLVGFFGSSHCLGMCGGLAAVIGQQRRSPSLVLVYNSGRLLTYTLLGAVAGLLGTQIVALAPGLALVLRTLAGLLVIAMGLYVSQWWLGLTRLEQWGSVIWSRLQPLVSKLMPVQNHAQALLLGSLWGLLPCGLVYSTLGWAVAHADWRGSALLMLGFGVGTLPAMAGVGLLSQSLLSKLRQGWVRKLAGAILIAMGVWTLLMPWLHAGHDAMSHDASAEHRHH